MSKEREQIAQLLADRDNYPAWEECGDITKSTYRATASYILQMLESFGYRRIPELTLIGDEEINKAFCDAWDKQDLEHPHDNFTQRFHRGIAQAQLNHTKRQIEE